MKTLENFACFDQFKKTIQGMRATRKEFEDGQQDEALTNQRDGRVYKKLKWTALHTSKCIQEAVFLLKEEEPSLSKEQLKKMLQAESVSIWFPYGVRKVEKALSVNGSAFHQRGWDRLGRGEPRFSGDSSTWPANHMAAVSLTSNCFKKE
ncbi:MAG: hypothetical protein HOB98_20650 [Gammaproteobacteria bacterium]|nr:hypothetical protein [Gammaproteobacteria bacterium]